MEGAIPSLCDAIGYDIPLSVKFSNDGAPMFIFTKNEMSIHFNMLVEVFDKDLKSKYLDLHYENMEIKFKMQLLQNMTLMVDWENVQMQNAYVVPYSFQLADE